MNNKTLFKEQKAGKDTSLQIFDLLLKILSIVCTLLFMCYRCLFFMCYILQMFMLGVIYQLPQQQ